MRWQRAASFALLGVAWSSDGRAGGGPMNVVVLYNSAVPEAVTVANHYAQARSIPASHLCAVTGITEAQTTLDVPTFQSMIQKPLDACIAALPEPELIDYVVLVRGLPYSVTLPTYAASLQAVIQVRHAKLVTGGTEIAGAGQPGNTTATVANPMFPPGFQGNASAFTLTNPYDTWYLNATVITSATAQPSAFHSANAPNNGGGYTVNGTSVSFGPNVYDWSGNNLVIVSALDGFDYTDATALVDRSVASDGTFPTAEIMCMAGADSARGARDPECQYATQMLAAAGLNGVFITPFDGGLEGQTVAAYFTGSDSLQGAIAGNTYVPGAMTDNLTSFGAAISNFFCNADGGTCPASESQTSCARFVRAGATGAHGTVNEPLNNSFPNAGALLLYTFGYSMGESYFFNQRFLYWQNIYLGDPLATPYAQRPVVTLTNGQPIVVHATHPNGIASINLYRSGKQVAQGTTDTLDYAPTDPVGTSLDLLAVAVAVDAPVTRTGWPKPNQSPHPEVQGWLAQTVVVGQPTPAADGGVDASTDASTGPPEGSSGCSCRQAPAEDGRWAWVSALALAMLALRRRGHQVPATPRPPPVRDPHG